jgi:hypothetical protein
LTKDEDLIDGLKPYLQDGEQLLWHGAPLPGIRNRRVRALKTLLGVGLLVWGIAILGALVDHVRLEGLFMNAPFFLLFGVVMISGGLHFGFLQWRDAARAHLTTRYVLTNRRACIVTEARFRSMDSHIIRPETAIELDRHEGCSDLWFHVRDKHGTALVWTTIRVGFEGIPDGDLAFMHLRSIQTGRA